MFNEGLIACVTSSLWLDDVKSPHGQVIPCSWKGNATTMDFTTGTFFISVPINELLLTTA